MDLLEIVLKIEITADEWKQLKTFVAASDDYCFTQEVVKMEYGNEFSMIHMMEEDDFAGDLICLYDHESSILVIPAFQFFSMHRYYIKYWKERTKSPLLTKWFKKNWTKFESILSICEESDHYLDF